MNAKRSNLTFPYCLGLDVSKAKLDGCLLKRRWRRARPHASAQRRHRLCAPAGRASARQVDPARVRVVLEATDDGDGFDPALLEREPRPGHLGFQLLRDRVEEAGGRLDVRSAHGAGTTVRVELPA